MEYGVTIREDPWTIAADTIKGYITWRFLIFNPYYQELDLNILVSSGKFTTLNLPDIFEEYRQQYGEIFKMIGMFGKPDNVLVFDPKDFETIYRTEGVWPVRRGLDTVEHYRRKVRPDIFGGGGLAIE